MTNCELLLMGFGFVMMLTVVGAMIFCWLEEQHMHRMGKEADYLRQVKKDWPGPRLNELDT